VPFLQHDRPRLRSASARAASSLDIERQLPRIVALLRDPEASVSSTARRILRPHVAAVGLEPLRSVLRDGPHEHGRFNAVSLGVSLGKWQSILILLEAAADGSVRIRQFAGSRITTWFGRQNRSFVQPTSTQLQELRTALDTYHAAVNVEIVAELRGILLFWEG
jgi:hypothetical protein